jgi:hypothetical protein
MLMMLFDWLMEMFTGESCNPSVIRHRENLSRRFQSWGYKDCTWLPRRR